MKHEGMRWCDIHEWQPLDSYFIQRWHDRTIYHCKLCNQYYDSVYRKQHRDKENTRKRRWYSRLSEEARVKDFNRKLKALGKEEWHGKLRTGS